MVVWRDSRTSIYNIYGQIIAASGALSGTYLVVNEATDLQTQPRVAYNAAPGANEYLVAWAEAGVADWDIYGPRVAVDGTLLDNPGTPADESDPAIGFPIGVANGKQEYPALAANPENGRWLVTWYDRRSDSKGDVYGQVVGAAGDLVGDEVTIAATPSTLEKDPVVTYNLARGEWLVVWRAADVCARRLDGGGSLLGSEFAVSAGSDIKTDPAVAANATQDEYLVVWQDDRNSLKYDVYGQRFAGDGSLIGGEFPVSLLTGQQIDPAAAYNPAQDGYLVVWAENRDGNWDVYGQRLTAATEPVGDLFRVSDAGAGGDQIRPRVAAAGESYLVVWEDERADTKGDIYGQVVLADGSLSGTNFAIAATADTYQDQAVIAYSPVQDTYLVA
jgi:hypothetical protein